MTADIRFRDALHQARSRRASDVHFNAGAVPAARVDGRLEWIGDAEMSVGDMERVAALLAGERERTRLDERGDVSVGWTDAELGSMRVHLFRANGRLSIAVRPIERSVPPLEKLGLPPAVETLAEKTHGLVMFAGPTGSGKSTSMAALVDRINAQSAQRIVTIEDPIEYRYSNRRSIVTQREIGRDTPNLAVALREVLRADPDVIVVGELRDAESIRGALTAAETGHLVFATIHTGDAAQTVERIVDAFEGASAAQVRTQLAGVLLAVICQRLVRRTGGGRRAAVELLVATDAVRNVIRESRTHQLRNAMLTGREHGMQTFEHHLAELLRSREIDAVEALRFGVIAEASAI
jgi:twitching motility protein PilT